MSHVAHHCLRPASSFARPTRIPPTLSRRKSETDASDPQSFDRAAADPSGRLTQRLQSVEKSLKARERETRLSVRCPD